MFWFKLISYLYFFMFWPEISNLNYPFMVTRRYFFLMLFRFVFLFSIKLLIITTKKVSKAGRFYLYVL